MRPRALAVTLVVAACTALPPTAEDRARDEGARHARAINAQVRGLPGVTDVRVAVTVATADPLAPPGVAAPRAALAIVVRGDPTQVAAAARALASASLPAGATVAVTTLPAPPRSRSRRGAIAAGAVGVGAVAAAVALALARRRARYRGHSAQ